MPKPKSRSEQLFDHALKFATPFTTTLGHAWAIIPDGPGRYHGSPIRSTAFHEWLAHGFHHEHELWPGCHAMRSAIRMLSAYAHRSEFPVSDVFTRLGWRGDRHNPKSVLLHLANTENELVEISPSGSNILAGKSWRFLAPRSTAPLPHPAAICQTLFPQLQSLCCLRDRVLNRAAVWLFAAMRPTGPYPILQITGPAASGKSTLARTLRTLIDPSSTPLLSPPSSDRDLFTLALHNRVLAFDNVVSLNPNIAASIERLATGVGLGISNRNIFDDPEPLQLDRPIIITTRTGHRAWFPANTIRVDLDTMKPHDIRTKRTLDERLAAAAPAVLGTLCEAVSAALSNVAATETAPISHFPDVHQWTTAAAPVLGLSTEQINRAVALHPLVDALDDLLETQSEWAGSATGLVQALNLPLTPESLSEQLGQLPLALFGLAFERGSSHGKRQVRVARLTSVAATRAAA